MPFLYRIRLRFFAVLAGLITAVIATVSLTALPALPVIGVALLTAAAVFNGMTARLAGPVCVGCGEDIAAAEAGTYGVLCRNCGALTQLVPPEPGGVEGRGGTRA